MIATSMSEGMLNMVEMAFRAYDPCLGCATHALPGRCRSSCACATLGARCSTRSGAGLTQRREGAESISLVRGRPWPALRLCVRLCPATGARRWYGRCRPG